MSKATILVVEDDVHLLDGIRDILQLDHYTVVTANNGEVGLQALRGMLSPPHLIVSDIMMPRMDGIQFLKEVRKNPTWISIPFIFLTAKGEKSDVLEGKRLGVDDYVIKPFDADELLVAVKSKLERFEIINDAKEGEISGIKRNILTIINHEFRTPLTYVVAYSELLKSDADKLSVDDMQMFLKGIDSGAERLRRLVENFITLVELESGEADANYRQRSHRVSNLAEMLESMSNLEGRLADPKGHTCKVSIEGQLPPIVADPDYLMKAINHLLDNAVKFSDTGTEVHLNAFEKGGQVHIAVQDFGRGIPEDELENIWKSFYQINRAEFEDQGAGSGLAIVRMILKLHGGEVDVVSEHGKGSTFTLIIPSVG